MGETDVHWPVPPHNGFTFDDMQASRDLSRRVELIDASLVFTSPLSAFHVDTVDLLVHGLRSTLPKEFRVRREIPVILDRSNAPAPDVTVISAHVGRDQLSCEPLDVHLAIEVVSPDSESRDRTTKPYKYGRAGIPHFWRVERDGTGRKPLVHVYELDPITRAYVHTGMHRDRIKVDKPYAIDVDLTAIEEL
ncbi:Uma2 family endonuclease [Streptomyces sp. 15-116A]|uniref:Uma2 family endonuclease n=1 Tax=Streptomyces sp. 15-116A TaxID=2259035 RepID=UPI0021B493CB|nr:Uma2 family endonuclease [Streptomyces sp. 15-116A]MCT7356159.1 Uma2 family endonuclease [Streptomyces sp. 15-116A]